MNNWLALLNVLVIVGMVAAAVWVYMEEDLLKSVIAMAVVGTFLALEFLILQAPDVAIAEAAVGAILTPVIFVIALRKVTDPKKKKGEGDKQ